MQINSHIHKLKKLQILFCDDHTDVRLTSLAQILAELL